MLHGFCQRKLLTRLSDCLTLKKRRRNRMKSENMQHNHLNTNKISMIGRFKTQTNRKWRRALRAAVLNQGPWETLGTVPVEEPTVWLQAGHSASSSSSPPPCSFNYRARARIAQEWCLEQLLFREAWCCSEKVLLLLIHCLHHRHDCWTKTREGTPDMLGWVIIRAVHSRVHWWRSWAKTWGQHARYPLSLLLPAL